MGLQQPEPQGSQLTLNILGGLEVGKCVRADRWQQRFGQCQHLPRVPENASFMCQLKWHHSPQGGSFSAAKAVNQHEAWRGQAPSWE